MKQSTIDLARQELIKERDSYTRFSKFDKYSYEIESIPVLVARDKDTGRLREIFQPSSNLLFQSENIDF